MGEASPGPRAQRTGRGAEGTALDELGYRAAVATVDAIGVESVVVRLGRGARLVGAGTLVDHARGQERAVDHLVLAAHRAGDRHRPAVRGMKRDREAVRRVAARALVGFEEHALAIGTADAVDAVDELLAVVGPGEAADRLSAHQR